MINKVYLFTFLFLLSLFSIEVKGAVMLDDDKQTTILLQQLDSAIAHIQEYDAAHEKAIGDIKQQLRHLQGGLTEEMALTDKLIEAYSKFNYDSTTVYINRYLKLAEQSGNLGLITRAKLRKAQFYAKTGAYLESVSILKEIDEDHLPDSILPYYYDACRDVYGESGYYSHDGGS